VRNHERETGIKSSTAKLKNRQSAIGNRQSPPLVAIVMGSQSDWNTMRNASETLKDFGLAHECRVISAHRSPQLAADSARMRRQRVLSDHRCRRGRCPSGRSFSLLTRRSPVLGVPMKSDALNGWILCSQLCKLPRASQSAPLR